jgi:hypothetical protein
VGLRTYVVEREDLKVLNAVLAGKHSDDLDGCLTLLLPLLFELLLGRGEPIRYRVLPYVGHLRHVMSGRESVAMLVFSVEEREEPPLAAFIASDNGRPQINHFYYCFTN